MGRGDHTDMRDALSTAYKTNVDELLCVLFNSINLVVTKKKK